MVYLTIKCILFGMGGFFIGIVGGYYVLVCAEYFIDFLSWLGHFPRSLLVKWEDKKRHERNKRYLENG